MPQFHRRVAFSGKKKKAQMRARRERKMFVKTDEGSENNGSFHQTPEMSGEMLVQLEGAGINRAGVNFLEEVEAINQQPRATLNTNTNRYNLKFRKETNEEVKRRKAAHYVEIESQPETVLEAASELFYPPGLGYPARPAWKKNMSKRELDISENRHFRIFCENLDRNFGGGDLSLYELNLETWRQLWRVTEMADIILVIVDARFPVSQFPPYLYNQLVDNEDKHIVLLMNKCDLVPAGVVAAWHHYFHTHYPKLTLVPFSSFEGYACHRAGKLKMAIQSSLRLVDACQRIVGDAVNLQSWRKKIEKEMEVPEEGMEEVEMEKKLKSEAPSTHPSYYQKFQDGVLTIGTIGYPNVGKSSLINALVGKKVVSVSKTPGHTKHFQTIFLTKSVKLCDCPGLVFPSCITKPLQVVSGSYPISQVRDPISVVQYIAARLDIPTILKLNQYRTPDIEDSRGNWTAYYICEAWARKRGYFMRSRGGPDVSRAANELLRLCLNAQKSLVLFLRPPGFTAERDNFEMDPLSEEIKRIQGIHAKDLEVHGEEEEDMCEGENYIDEQEDSGERSEETVLSGSEDEEESEEEQYNAKAKNRFALLSENY